MGQMILRSAAVFALLSIIGCSEAATDKPPEPVAHFSQSDELSADAFAVVFDSASPRPAIEAEARSLCGERQWCKVFGWTDAGSAARALPMTDRELEAQVFALTINRASGMDEAVWMRPE